MFASLEARLRRHIAIRVAATRTRTTTLLLLLLPITTAALQLVGHASSN